MSLIGCDKFADVIFGIAQKLLHITPSNLVNGIFLNLFQNLVTSSRSFLFLIICPLKGSQFKTNNEVNLFKVRLSPSKKIICFNKSPLKMMENAFYFILKALFVFKIFNFFSGLFVHVEETA